MFRTLLAAIALSSLATIGSAATLIGDSIGLDARLDGGGVLFNTTATVVDPGVEASYNVGQVRLDISAASFDLFLRAGTSLSRPLILSLTDLDFDGGETVSGLRLASMGGGAAASDVQSVNFGDDFASVRFSPLSAINADRTYSFAIDTVAPVPLPAGLPLLGGGLLLVGALRRKRPELSTAGQTRAS